VGAAAEPCHDDCVSWFTTGDVDGFLAEAGEFLRAECVRNTVILTVAENLRVKGQVPIGGQPAQDEPLFGWWRPGGDGNQVRGAFMHTPAFPVFLTSMSQRAAAELAGDLAAAGRLIQGVNAESDAAEAFAEALAHHTGTAATVHRRMRLFVLGELVRPHPGPEGASRPAAERDRDLLTEWLREFTREVGDPDTQDYQGAADERLGYGGIVIWEAGGVPASIAGRTRIVAGTARVGPVYTPPELRGRGYAGGATVAVSQAALDAGATEVVLYTDLANPTSNALYQRLGYRSVEDRLVLSFEPAIRS
jgi:predicted GNAT family acetyltransferase